MLLSDQTFAVKGDSISISPVYPDNQIGGQKGYFNLMVKPEEKQTIEIKIKNSSDKAVKANVTSFQASTSNAGVITYSNEKVDAGIKFPFAEMAKLKKNQVDVPARGEVIVPVELTIPKEEFDVKVIGGITVFEERALSKSEKEQSVVNEFQYVIPVVLFENMNKVEPDIHLTNIEPGIRNYSTYIEATLQNKAQINISKMEINGAIKRKKDDSVLINRKELNYTMAPVSSFNFGFDLQGTAVEPGNYVAEFTIVADGKIFNLSQDFKITKEQASEVNSQNLYGEEKSKIPVWLIIIGVVVIIIIATIAFILYKKKLSKKTKSKRVKKKKRK